MTELPPSTPEENRDTVWATVLLMVAVGLAGLFWLWSQFTTMIPADSCTPEKCNEDLVGISSLVTVIGLPIAVGIGLIGVSVAARRRRRKWVPACASLVAVVACVIVWFVLNRGATPDSMG